MSSPFPLTRHGRKFLAVLGLLLSIGMAGSAQSAFAVNAAGLNLETLTAAQAEKMLRAGEVTSVELVKAYEARIAAINKAGPGINAVTQLNPEVLKEAQAADRNLARHRYLGPAMGVPILVKDIIDATPMYTSAGDWALRESFPEKDSGVAKELRAHGVVILGKAGLSEWANSFGSQPSGFSNLTGQVLNANDAAQGPSGSSSGSGAAAAAGLATLTIGTETSGSIISPSTAENVVGLRPTLGLVPGYGIAPIDASQDTAGPIVKTVEDAAITLQSIAEVTGTDPEANEEYESIMGPEFLKNGDIQPAPFTTLPDYTSALKMSYVAGKRIGYNGTTCSPTPCTLTAQEEANQKAVTALEGAGAILVKDEPTTVPALPPLPTGYEQHATIDDYYHHLGPAVPVKSLVQEIEVDATDPQEALKFGNSSHAKEAEAEDTPGGANQQAYDKALPERKKLYHEAIEKMMNEPSGGGGPVIAVIGSVPSGPQAGLPEMAVPMGYTATQRRSLDIDVNGGAYDELNILGVGYVVEQATKLHKTPAEVNPAMYRCARTVPAEPFAGRGSCNPNKKSIEFSFGLIKKLPPTPLETTSAAKLEEMLGEGAITSAQLVRAELYRITLINADGPALQAVRAINPSAITEAMERDLHRAHAKGPLGPLYGIPVLVNDSVDVFGVPTSGGSIALQEDLPEADATIVAKLKAAGAIILGTTNTTELEGDMEPANMAQGYSSLGGQVLLASDTNKSPGGSSAGSAVAVSTGLAPLAIGMEAGPESAQLIAPAGNAGLVGLKPTVGLVSRTGILPASTSQDSPGPIGQTVADVATALQVLAGPDPTDPATGEQPTPLPSYTEGLLPTALSGKKIAIVSNTTVPYPAAVAELEALGATTTTVTPGTATAEPSVIPYEVHKGLDSFLSGSREGVPKTLQQVIEYNEANPVEGLKFGQHGLTAAEAVEYTNPATTTAYEEHLANGRSQDQAVLAHLLEGGAGAIMVPSGSALVGVADRAGYPVLTVPAGYAIQNSSTGGDPVGVDFIGAPYSEASLLAYGYAFEQGVNARFSGPSYMLSTTIPNPTFSGAPSETNQSMFRCVPGSAFYKPYDCNPE